MLWFALVLSLPLVLREAERHAVEEVVVQPGHPVTFHGEQGALVLGHDLDEATISDALSVVLGPEQQAELAVAGVVEFYVEGYAEWTLLAESGTEGVIIRGRIRDGATPDGLGVPLELPPLEPFEPDGPDLPAAPDSVLRSGSTRSTRWDVGVAGAVLDEMPATGSLDDHTLDDVPSRPPDEPDGSLPPRPRSSAWLLDDDAAAIDFALVGRTAPTGELPDLHASGSATMPRLVAGTRPTLRSDDTLAMHVDALDPGTVVFLAGVGVGERLLQPLEEGYEVIDLDTWDEVTTRPYEELPADRGYLVRLEDPSRCLGWLLRRLEEGARVVVETRARTAAGARRSMLGIDATPHAEAWLDAHPQLWLHADGRTWVLERV